MCVTCFHCHTSPSCLGSLWFWFWEWLCSPIQPIYLHQRIFTQPDEPKQVLHLAWSCVTRKKPRASWTSKHIQKVTRDTSLEKICPRHGSRRTTWFEDPSEIIIKTDIDATHNPLMNRSVSKLAPMHFHQNLMMIIYAGNLYTICVWAILNRNLLASIAWRMLPADFIQTHLQGMHKIQQDLML